MSIESYPILLKESIIPTLSDGTISDIVLSYIRRELTFQVSLVENDEILHMHAKYLDDVINGKDLSYQHLADIGPVMGYNRKYLFPTISNPKNSRGAIEIIGNKLIFYERGNPLHSMRDSFVFGYAHYQFFVARDPAAIAQEFLEKDYALFLGERQIGRPGYLLNKNFENLRKIDFKYIRDRL
jgi:hypothetical protein